MLLTLPHVFLSWNADKELSNIEASNEGKFKERIHCSIIIERKKIPNWTLKLDYNEKYVLLRLHRTNDNYSQQK